MSWGNRYFRFDEPIRWFKAVGYSESNTWIGRSRVIDTVYEPTTINPEDHVHALVGGTFLVREDGSIETGRLRLPKPILEKTYGNPTTDADLLAMMAKVGRCREVDKPAGSFDYNSARTAIEANRLPPLTGLVPRGRKWPNSPTLDLILEAYRETETDEALNAAGAVANAVDVGMGGSPDSLEASLVFKFDDGRRISISGAPTHRELWVRDSAQEFGNALKHADCTSLGLTPDFRNDMVTVFREDQSWEMMAALGRYIEHGRFAEPVAPKS